MTRRRILFLVAVGLIALVAFLYWLNRPRLTVTVRNEGPHVLRGVVVQVGDSKYPLEDVGIMESASVKVHAGGKAQLEIEFTDAAGKPTRLPVTVFVPEKETSTLLIVVKNDRIERIENSGRPAS